MKESSRVPRGSPHLDSSWFGFLYNINEIRISGVLELVSCDRVEWAQALGFRHQREAHQFMAEPLTTLIMSRSCSDYQRIKERNYDDLHQSMISPIMEFLNFFGELRVEFLSIKIHVVLCWFLPG